MTGGVRSGKSFHAESLLVAEPQVTYVAPGPTIEEDPDPDWVRRIHSHQERRPKHWKTVETHDLAAAISGAEGAVLVDDLGTWLSAQIDQLDGWDSVEDEWQRVLTERIDQAAEAVAHFDGTVVLVTNEVGMGVVPAHRSGRIFRDFLGLANQSIADECDEVLLVVAGRVLSL